MGERASWQYPSNGIYRWRSIKPPGCETTVLPICFGRIYRHGAREREGKRETNVVLQFLQPTTSYFARSIVTRKNTSSYFSRLITSLCPNLKCKWNVRKWTRLFNNFRVADEHTLEQSTSWRTLIFVSVSVSVSVFQFSGKYSTIFRALRMK